MEVCTGVIRWISGGGAPTSGEEAAPTESKQTVVATQKQLIAKKGEIHIVEEKVFAALGNGAERDSCRWVLDTDASNHMSGCRGEFSCIDGGTVGTVKFTNGSVVDIEGVGIILYECKNGDHSNV
jgi:hypothetical protein